MNSLIGLRLNGFIKSFNPSSGKGWLKYSDGQSLKEIQFFKNNLINGAPKKDDPVTFTIKKGKVFQLWIQDQKKEESIISINSNNDVHHVVTVFHPNIYKKENVILKHALKLKEVKEKDPEGFIYWGKIVEVSGDKTPSINEEWVDKVNREIEKAKAEGKKSKLIVTDFQEVFIAPLLKVHYSKTASDNLEKYELMPDYYLHLKNQGRPCEVFFEINDLFQMERECILNDLKYQDANGRIRNFSPYESNITYPKLVFDEHYLIDDGNNFDPEFMNNDKKAHFYKITNDEGSHNEQLISNVCLNLMDEECWLKLPPITRTYIIEAELGYQRVHELYKNRPDEKITGVRVCMSYLNAIEGLLKDPAGRNKENGLVPYVSFRNEYMRKNKEKGSMDFLIKIFFDELLSSKMTLYESIRTFNGDEVFEEHLRKNNHLIKLSSYIRLIYDLRNKEAHPTTEIPYEFRELRKIRNAFWGITSSEGILEEDTGLPIINLLLKLYSIYDKKQRWINRELSPKRMKIA